MPTLSRPWGVTPEKVASRIQSFNLTESSSPSLQDVEEIITEHATWVAGRLRRVGVGPDLDAESETVGIVRGVLFRLVIGEVTTLRGRDDTNMASLIRSAEQVIAAIDVGPQGLGDDAQASRSHRMATSASKAREVERFNATHAATGVILATRNKL